MINSKLYKIYSSLSMGEQKEFRKFIRSPIYNQHQEVILLADYFETAQKDTKILQREVAYSALFPNKSFNYNELRHLMSYLFKVLKKYLIFLEMQVEEMESRILLCRALRKRNLEKMFTKERIESHQFQQNQPFRNTNFHYYNYLLASEEYQFRHQKTRSSESNLEELSNELATFFLSDTLRRSGAALSHSAFSKKEYPIKLLPEVMEHIEKNDYQNVPAISLYFNCYKALAEPENEVYFQSLKTLLPQHLNNFPKSELRNIYLLAINYCIYKMNRGRNQFLREGFELYQSGLQNELLMENGFLSAYTYKNIAIIGLKLNEKEWVKNYLEKYKKYLRPENQENNYTLNLAHFYFRINNFQESMRLLQQTDFQDVLHNLDARRMLLIMYFELREYEALDSLLESFTTFIRRKEIGYHAKNYQKPHQIYTAIIGFSSL